ncbi:putative succinyl-coA:3-ketoacid-coenzyme A transferase, mitochondrial precursor [Leishmania major strain Friedlin]|uniref:Succinyl-CoA:3-ketoacid-coenzyme A transferase n=1 Tax=Leishmania major TaxID=5664 RepID=Q4Q3V3_LEIMA|nr:putative succinyl-coA:3-ketoacid-coenzyme A transferase, mitochondrial precursor [Leishmania major strain Friedlin]CAG9580852.1 succinyl-coA:3-ketoacid-coenzyme_A_transferase_-_mitochondrial_precursor_-_putative [Leishmania major strain Friedlin]CAJ06634.1 putative succinyl-coA:3-ketoacid-coenzyme A transferase, mitochondrial precursor [Leishmania major strain Friedlin]|eukprot:XP_001685995.1 putative succinyl-coA:3-ketoacid-coenzyme A transferase, mitochondrial precursor [Leishmania major strain Friedlin]
MLRRNFWRLVGLDKVQSLEEAVADMTDGISVAVGGFGCSGVPDAVISAMCKKGPKDMILYTDSAGIDGFGLARLIETKQVRRICCSFVGMNKIFKRRYLEGDVELEFVPQGTLAERMRAGGAGIPAFYTATAYGTQRQTGGQIIRYDKNGVPCVISAPKETRQFGNRWYVLEETIRPDYAIVKALKADKSGNLVFRGTARNFNIPAAQCGRRVIAEVEQVVENGEIHPDDVHLPGVYVHRVVQASYEVPIEKRTVSGSGAEPSSVNPNDDRQKIARRAALEFTDGVYANLGIGIPTEAANYMPAGVTVTLHSENGLLGMGPFPTADKVSADWINAGKQTISFLPGAACFDSATSFAMIRGGHMNLTMLGALEVSSNGDLANWGIPGKLVNGPGGAMDLVASGSRVVVTMSHCNKRGDSKLVERCSLPVTGLHCVTRIITEKAVFDVIDKHLVLKEVAEGLTVDDIKKCTAAHFEVDKVKPIAYAAPISG